MKMLTAVLPLYLFLVTILFSTVATFGSPGSKVRSTVKSCEALFTASSSNIPSESVLSSYLISTRDFQEKVSKLMSQQEDPASLWAKQFERRQGGFGYRGMVLAPKEISLVLQEGLKLKKSIFERIYFTDDPRNVIGWMFNALSRTGYEKGVAVILVLKDPEMWENYQDRNIWTFEKDVPVEAIKSIWAFNPKAPAESPFVMIYKSK